MAVFLRGARSQRHSVDTGFGLYAAVQSTPNYSDCVSLAHASRSTLARDTSTQTLIPAIQEYLQTLMKKTSFTPVGRAWLRRYAQSLQSTKSTENFLWFPNMFDSEAIRSEHRLRVRDSGLQNEDVALRKEVLEL